MSSLPPTTNSPVFNSSFFLRSNDYLTIATADKRYQKLGWIGVFSSLAVAVSLDCGSLTIAGAAVDLSSLSGVTAGTVAASKLLMVDANKDISSFRNLTAVNLTGTLLTAAQPNITSIGTLSSLNVSGGLTASTLTGTLSTAAQPNITSLGTLTTGLQTTINNNTTSFASYARWTNSLTTPMNCVLEMSNIAPRTFELEP
ncbi:hypothetical protein F443_17299 [Phytophthora nicotianae P1569]|uniref:Uncharacterized protein n=1 Tax=Phytophthora nicotianae P1569 TaxID=1317065 RepID=V9EEY2_PHYNI|nr:hypothetical protein F443_17299 [Phytophthora nicotianae P1569]